MTSFPRRIKRWVGTRTPRRPHPKTSGPQAHATPIDAPTSIERTRDRWNLDDRVLDCMVAYNRFGGYVVPRAAAHRVAARRVLNGKVYEPRTIELLQRECGTGDIIHAGTFFGDFLPALSSGLTPGALVYAFEPNPENYRCAAMTVDLNGIENVVLECAGLGSEPGISQMQTVGRDGTPRGGSSRIVDDSAAHDLGLTTEIPIDTIDARVPAERSVSVLQLDVEGYEQAALAGAMATISRCRPVIVVETLPDEEWVAENLMPLGYRVAEVVHHNTVLRV